MKRPLIISALGVSLSALLGSGLVAAVVDAGASRGQNLGSGEFTGPNILQLAATSPGNTSCSGVTWTDVLGPVTVGSADLNEATLTLNTNQRICIRSKRSGTYQARMGVRSVLERETACSTSGLPEVNVDTTCGGGDAGELGRVLRLNIQPQIAAGPTSSCGGTQSRSFAAANLDAGNSPYDICTLSSTDTIATFFPLLFVDQGATNGDLTLAQSDAVQWEYSITLER
jgi:hypothetical protein